VMSIAGRKSGLRVLEVVELKVLRYEALLESFNNGHQCEIAMRIIANC
jgi:hypothetical protein